SYLLQPVRVAFSFEYDADFADIFEVRGTRRERRGEALGPVVGADHVALSYRGLDHAVRRTTIRFSPTPASVQASRADFECTLPPHGEETCTITICCEPPGKGCAALAFDDANRAASEELHRSRAGDARIWSSNEWFNDWLRRSAADLHLMLTHTPKGPYPY